jgi:hypothetical protein
MPAREIGTYTIYLCRNGKRFKTLTNVAENIPRPRIGETIGDVTGKWRVRSVINDGTSAVAIVGKCARARSGGQLVEGRRFRIEFTKHSPVAVSNCVGNCPDWYELVGRDEGAVTTNSGSWAGVKETIPRGCACLAFGLAHSG